MLLVNILIKIMRLFKNKYFLILLICLLFGGFIGVLHPIYPDFDFFSYHYANAWSFLNERLGLDFMTCQARSYYNPILDCINYVIIQKLNNHPYLFLFISNFKYGMYIFLTFLIADYVFIDNNSVKKIGIASVLFLTILSPVVLLCTRMDANDIQIANMVLIVIYLQIKYIFKENTTKKKLFLLVSAFIMGCAVGLKNSAIVFVLPMVISTLLYLKKDALFLKTVLLMFVFAVSGFLLFDGWWLYSLWKLYGNPIFPYSNNIFQSPMADISNYTYTEYEHLRQNSVFDYLFAPLKNTINNKFLGLENLYYEPKMNFSFISIAIILILYNFKTFKNKMAEYVKPEIIMIFIIYSVLCYYTNSVIFGTLRYVIALAPLCAVIITVLTLCYTKTLKGKIIYPLLIFVLVWSLYTFTFNYITKIENNKLIDHIVYIEKTEIGDDAIIFCGNQMSCFVAPAQNSNVTYIAYAIPKHIQNTSKLFVTTRSPYRNYYYTSDYLENKIKNAFKTDKPIYIFFNFYNFVKDRNVYNSTLEYYTEGKINTFKNCTSVPNEVLGIPNSTVICRLK